MIQTQQEALQVNTCSAAQELALETWLTSETIRLSMVLVPCRSARSDFCFAGFFQRSLPMSNSVLTKMLVLLGLRTAVQHRDRNLVDPASSHMLVSKIKPCMSQYESQHGETANGSLKQF